MNLDDVLNHENLDNVLNHDLNHENLDNLLNNVLNQVTQTDRSEFQTRLQAQFLSGQWKQFWHGFGSHSFLSDFFLLSKLSEVSLQQFVFASPQDHPGSGGGTSY